MNRGFKVGDHPRRKGANPSPPTGIVVKHPKTTWQPVGHCPSHMFFEAQTHSIVSVGPIKRCLDGDF